MRFLIVPALLALALLASGCEDEPVVTQDIVSTTPWPDHERAEYVLLNRDGERERGRGVLEASREGNTYELNIRFEGNGNTDESTVTVDAETLKPLTVRRELTGEDDASFEAEYDAVEGVVRIVETTDGDEREIPRRIDKEHYYDNESSLYLWRTIDFREGFEAAYHTVLANQGGVQRVVRLRVVGKEGVTVPAGTFEAWRVEVRSGDRRQIVWYADTPERRLVQYDNSRDLLQLTAIE
jgi:hypothetical protein